MQSLAEPQDACLYLFYGPIGEQTSQQVLHAVCRLFWPNEQQTLRYNAYGKPYLANQSLFFNLSHQQDMIVIGFSRNEVGVDLQFPAPQHNWRRLTERCASPSERPWINTCQDFYRLWVLKEAYFKAIGKGLSHNFQNTQFTLEANNYYEVNQQNRNKTSSADLIEIHSDHSDWYNYLINRDISSGSPTNTGYWAICSERRISDIRYFDMTTLTCKARYSQSSNQTGA
ncbi:4'-phosphopantetheinyl transferase family protein [Motilimonas pumila]|uniref:4'-phosphopantetheinyl transferase superfamily protein n=1 Tax=Motilimonas pumila TaxID=2303987 RepID=A0A418YIF2_9GAMM|nr:4'-phosphopantetheinyl transferase superfamily protein [Motilimonas pumila]RJG50431.1 4'-phosphopantetheinyl transferase superfamily protein [Motilimonas pumila]